MSNVIKRDEWKKFLNAVEAHSHNPQAPNLGHLFNEMVFEVLGYTIDDAPEKPVVIDYKNRGPRELASAIIVAVFEGVNLPAMGADEYSTTFDACNRRVQAILAEQELAQLDCTTTTACAKSEPDGVYVVPGDVVVGDLSGTHHVVAPKGTATDNPITISHYEILDRKLAERATGNPPSVLTHNGKRVLGYKAGGSDD